MHSHQSSSISRILQWLAALVVLLSLKVSAASLTASQGVYAAGQPISIAYTGPGNSHDWIGLYAAGAWPAENAYVDYRYVDNSNPPASYANGSVTFPNGLPTPGSYVAYLFEDNGYRVLASEPFTVVAATDPLLQASKPVYNMGEAITISFARGPGNAKDWIGFYPAGASPSGTSAAYRYVDNTTTGSTGLTEGSITLPDGLRVPGGWVAYLFENDSYNVLAQETFSVAMSATPTVTIAPDHSIYAQGQPVTVTFSGGPGDPRDWIGVYLDGQIPGGPNSTNWRYVNNTQTSGEGRTSGEVTFPNGFSAPGVYDVYFLLNDGYSIAGAATFTVAEGGLPFVQTSKQVFEPSESISINFTNASGFATDWVAIYPSGIVPDGTPAATLWNYTDGTRTGTAGILEGSVTFAQGLAAGEYTAFLLENDTYTVLAQQNFTVRSSAPQTVRLLSISPANNEANTLASPQFTAVLENLDTSVNQSSIRVTLDPGQPTQRTLTPQITTADNRVTINAAVTDILAANSTHTINLAYTDDQGEQFNENVQFTVGDVVNITLPTPVFFENFNSTPEGSVPAGWTVSNQSDSADIAADLHNLGSAAYNNFTVVSASRLGGNFIAYNDATETTRPIADILSRSDDSFVVNGALVRNLAEGNVLVGVSGYHSGNNQVLEAITPSINLSGKSEVHLSFHSLLQQNQDSIAGVEVSNDGGATWSPVVYYLDPTDIVRLEGGAVDSDSTFNTVRSDIAVVGAEGGFYGYFLKAPINEAAGAAIQPRINDSPADGTRVEVIRVAQADNQANVKFRLFYAGTDSWYFGVDNFGVYSMAQEQEARITYTLNGASLTLNWPALPGYVLQSSTTLAPGSWSNVQDVTGNSYTTSTASGNRFFRLFKP